MCPETINYLIKEKRENNTNLLKKSKKRQKEKNISKVKKSGSNGNKLKMHTGARGRKRERDGGSIDSYTHCRIKKLTSAT